MSRHTPGPWKAAGELVYFGRAGGISLCDAPNPEANANLIAAAPDLLRALEGLLDQMRRPPNAGDRHRLDLNPSLAAIAKAKAKGQSK